MVGGKRRVQVRDPGLRGQPGLQEARRDSQEHS